MRLAFSTNAYLRYPFDEAADHFRAALATDEGNAAAHLNLGTILMARREYAQARREFDRVVALDPGNSRVQASLAELDLQLRNYEESLAHASEHSNSIPVKRDTAA